MSSIVEELFWGSGAVQTHVDLIHWSSIQNALQENTRLAGGEVVWGREKPAATPAANILPEKKMLEPKPDSK